MELRGIDISKHNGNIDFNKLKGNIDFAIVRTSFGFFNEDLKYREYIKGLESNGIPYGLYHYSYARNLDEAKIEVEGFLNIARQYNPTYPLVLDMEDADNWKLNNGNPSNDMYVQICEYFCKKIEEAGYYAMIYASKSWLETKLNDSRLDRFDKWLAQWSSKPTYDKSFGIWQYTSDGSVPGISGRVDMNISYVDYPSIIKGTSASTPSVPSSSGCDQILRVGSVVRIDRPLTVTAISGNLIAIQELTGKPTASYHWFDPTNFEVVEGPKKAKQVCSVGCKVKLHGEYSVLGLVKTEDWACKLKIGNRTNWVWTNPCYEVRD